jgi:hypothetical protein
LNICSGIHDVIEDQNNVIVTLGEAPRAVIARL